MDTSLARSSVTRRRTVEGAGLWLLVLVPLAVLGPLGLRGLLLALAPLVLVPLALPLLGVRPALDRPLQPAALLAVAALLLPAGPAAALLATPYAALALLLGLSALLRLRRDRALLPAAAVAWLGVGAGWLVLSRAGLHPLGYTDAVVELTAVHFHVAGLAATVLAACAARAGGPRWAALTVALAPPVVAAGYVGPEVLQLVGAVLLTAGLLRLAAWSLRHETDALVRLWAAELVLAMPLAVLWSLGVVYGVPHLTLGQMAATHGVLNALGAAAGLAGRTGERPL